MQISDLARKAVAGGWSVRELEAAVKALARGEAPPRKRAASKDRDPAVAALEDTLQVVTGSRVAIRLGAKGEGTIRIPFKGPRDLERLFHIITGEDAGEVVG